jgi:hypothetical protein
MSALERQQRGLLDLIKGRGAPPQDAYFAQVAHSAGLVMVREIALWWRAMQLDVQCRYTSRLLKRTSRFEGLVAAYFDAHATSSFVEELSRDFLQTLQTDADVLVAATAGFEYALMEAHADSSESFEILWDRDPDAVVVALEQRSALPPPDADWTYRMRVGAGVPNLVRCSRERKQFRVDNVREPIP